jgi:hypothetical protein
MNRRYTRRGLIGGLVLYETLTRIGCAEPDDAGKGGNPEWVKSTGKAIKDRISRSSFLKTESFFGSESIFDLASDYKATDAWRIRMASNGRFYCGTILQRRKADSKTFLWRSVIKNKRFLGYNAGGWGEESICDTNWLPSETSDTKDSISKIKNWLPSSNNKPQLKKGVDGPEILIDRSVSGTVEILDFGDIEIMNSANIIELRHLLAELMLRAFL